MFCKENIATSFYKYAFKKGMKHLKVILAWNEKYEMKILKKLYNYIVSKRSHNNNNSQHDSDYLPNLTLI